MRGISAGVHEDQVDALGLIGRLLDTIRPGWAPAAPPKPSGGMAGYRSTRGGSADGWRRA